MMSKKNTAIAIRSDNLWTRYQQLSPSKKFIIAVFMIWLVQAIPKWTVAVTADGELSAQIMKMFITPRAETTLSMSRLDLDLDYSNQPVLMTLHS